LTETPEVGDRIAVMSMTFRPEVLNGPGGDPVVLVRIRWSSRRFLLDLGDLGRLSTKEALRVSDVFVSHTHMDHFIGFDQLLRVHLGRPTNLRLWGPPGLIEQVRARLGGYTWNLTGSYALTLEVRELDGETLTAALFRASDGFRDTPLPDTAAPSGKILKEAELSVTALPLDHGIPSLGFRIEEPEQWNVDADALESAGLATGAWVGDMKRHALATEPLVGEIDAETTEGSVRRLPLEDAVRRFLLRGPGHVIAYASDFVYSEENAVAIRKLAQGADPFLCEGTFRETHCEEARERMHLTALQAGMLAERAGAQRLVLFHISPRFHGAEEELLREAEEAFSGPVGLG
jgi:ribonuclease Z